MLRSDWSLQSHVYLSYQRYTRAQVGLVATVPRISILSKIYTCSGRVGLYSPTYIYPIKDIHVLRSGWSLQSHVYLSYQRYTRAQVGLVSTVPRISILSKIYTCSGRVGLYSPTYIYPIKDIHVLRSDWSLQSHVYLSYQRYTRAQVGLVSTVPRISILSKIYTCSGRVGLYSPTYIYPIKDIHVLRSGWSLQSHVYLSYQRYTRVQVGLVSTVPRISILSKIYTCSGRVGRYSPTYIYPIKDIHVLRSGWSLQSHVYLSYQRYTRAQVGLVATVPRISILSKIYMCSGRIGLYSPTYIYPIKDIHVLRSDWSLQSHVYLSYQRYTRAQVGAQVGLVSTVPRISILSKIYTCSGRVGLYSPTYIYPIKDIHVLRSDWSLQSHVYLSYQRYTRAQVGLVSTVPRISILSKIYTCSGRVGRYSPTYIYPIKDIHVLRSGWSLQSHVYLSYQRYTRAQVGLVSTVPRISILSKIYTCSGRIGLYSPTYIYPIKDIHVLRSGWSLPSYVYLSYQRYTRAQVQGVPAVPGRVQGVPAVPGRVISILSKSTCCPWPCSGSACCSWPCSGSACCSWPCSGICCS